MAEHARELANETYPQILALLGQPISRVPLQFDIVFKQQLESGNVGQARLEEIQLSAAWIDGPSASLPVR